MIGNIAAGAQAFAAAAVGASRKEVKEKNKTSGKSERAASNAAASDMQEQHADLENQGEPKDNNNGLEQAMRAAAGVPTTSSAAT